MFWIFCRFNSLILNCFILRIRLISLILNIKQFKIKELNLQKIQNKLRKKFLASGVKMLGPETIFFSSDTKVGKNVTIEPYVVIGKNVKIGNNVVIKSFSHLESCKVENKVEIGPYAFFCC